MSGAGSLNKLRAALIIFFVIFLIALFAQLFYTLRRRRLLRQTKAEGGGGGGEVVENRNTYSSPKDPLSFIRLASLESNAIAAPSYGNIPDSDAEILDIDLLMLQGLFGPPRFLYTIKEEREDWGSSPSEKSRFSTSRIDEIKRSISRNRVTLADRFKAAEDYDFDSNRAVEMKTAATGGAGYVNASPSSTPRASPLIPGEGQI